MLILASNLIIMKKLFVLLFFIPVFAYAQDTCQLQKTTDVFTKEARISTGFIPFLANGVQLHISIDATSSEIDFFLWIKNDSKCFDSQSGLQVNYDGERLKANFKNTGSMNCEGAFHFTFRNTPATPSNLKRFTDKRIASIKLTGTGNTITEISFNEEQKQLLQRMANCVVNESKTLMKK